jgi:hypothetical protein
VDQVIQDGDLISENEHGLESQPGGRDPAEGGKMRQFVAMLKYSGHRSVFAWFPFFEAYNKILPAVSAMKSNAASLLRNEEITEDPSFFIATVLDRPFLGALKFI